MRSPDFEMGGGRGQLPEGHGAIAQLQAGRGRDSGGGIACHFQCLFRRGGRGELLKQAAHFQGLHHGRLKRHQNQAGIQGTQLLFQPDQRPDSGAGKIGNSLKIQYARQGVRFHGAELLIELRGTGSIQTSGQLDYI